MSHRLLAAQPAQSVLLTFTAFPVLDTRRVLSSVSPAYILPFSPAMVSATLRRTWGEAASDRRLGCTTGGPTSSLVLTTLAIALALMSPARAATSCRVCQGTTPVCDDVTGRCDVRCDYVKTCDGDGDGCVATMYLAQDNQTSEMMYVVDTGCWAGSAFNTLQPDDCRADNRFPGMYTCLCGTDECNREIILPHAGAGGASAPASGGDIPPDFLKDPPSPPVGSGGSPWPGDGLDDPTLRPGADRAYGPDNTSMLIGIVTILPAVLVLVLLIFAAYVLYRRRHPKNPPSSIFGSEDGNGNYQIKLDDFDSEMAADPSLENTLNHNEEHLPIKLDTSVGKGRFAEVWKGKLFQESEDRFVTVAVKIFRYDEKQSWQREKDVFSDPALKHPNILDFLTAEERGSGIDRQYWLITSYHSNGCLRAYLGRHVLTWEQLCVMSQTTVAGLAYLHADRATDGAAKMPIAHRDVKSSNVLVKSDGTCCLADFGLALNLDPTIRVEEYANSGQVGTPRYMAPEALESRVNLVNLESFKQIDVYALGLVLWEMLARCEVTGDVGPYQPAFADKLSGDHPGIDTMKDVVIRERERPDIPSHWLAHQGLCRMSEIIEDCWDHDGEARITASCAEERINELKKRQFTAITIDSEDDEKEPLRPKTRYIEETDV
ncbi:TGF-beta receptor type-2-like isoform X2 [Branchiostoma floridae x Branchiostoma belcheri]